MDKIKLSVVIPIYNVQEYLLDCVNSVINQNLNIEEYEILLLNDGSSDKSSDIAKALASEYKNIRYFFFENSGLGATRNKGIDLAKGTYITFLDSDDIVPQIAYETLLTTAMKNNSDVVTAPVERFENNKFLRSGLHKRVKFDPAEKVTLKEYKELVYDTTSTNKIYKLSFLKNNNLYFPVNILYEDIYFSLRVFALSTNISVVDQVSYIWRIRSGENVSITQNRLNIQGYKDRLNTVLKTLNFLREHCEEVVANEFEKKIIDFDIPLFFPDYKNGDLEYTKDFVLETINILKALKVSYIEECDYRKQAIYYAIFKHDYETVLNYSLDNIKEFKMEVRNGEVQLTDKFLSNEIINKINPLNIVDIYSEFSEVVYNKKEVIINCKVKSSVMKDINKTSNENISAFLYSANDLIEVKLNRVDKEDYQIIIPLELIPYTSSFNRLKVKLVYTINDNVYSETLLSDPKNKKLKTTLMKPLRGYNLNIQNNFNWELFIEKKKTETIFKEITIERDNLIVKTNMIDEDAIYLLDNNKDKPLEGKVVNQRLIFNLNKLKQEKVMELKVLKSGAKTYNFQFDKKPSFFTVFNTLNYNEYVLRVYNNHSFSISKKGKHSTLKNIIFDNKKINIIFEAPYNFNNISKVRLLLNSINGKVSKEISARHIGENNYIASIDLTHATQNTFFPYGEYKIYIDYYNNQKLLPQSQLLNERKNIEKSLKYSFNMRNYSFEFRDGHQVILKNKEILKKYENTKPKRDKLRKYIYPIFRKIPINKNKIIFYSYWGDQYSCSPKEIYEYVEENYNNVKSVWIANDDNLPIKGKGRVVKKNSLKYWYDIATAKYFIQNTNMPVDYKKRKGQKEVQTFHGTFLKTMGFDTPEIKFSQNETMLKDFARKIDNWDYFTTPSEYMVDKVKSAFETNAKPLKVGFPRNDLIFKSLSNIENIKEKLNIDKKKKVILYAPTWREGKSPKLTLDLDYLEKSLSEEYVLLIKAHYFLSRQISIRDNYPFAINVSSYPCIEELYAISDMLITDYSSTMFDYAYLKRPIVFYAFDLEKYVYGERGIYLDYMETMPGPIARTNVELLKSIKEVENGFGKYEAKFDDFYNQFCQFGCEGESTKEFVKHFFKFKGGNKE